MSRHTRRDNDANRTADNLARQARHNNQKLDGQSIEVFPDGSMLSGGEVVASPERARSPYYTEEKSFTTRPGGPDTATLMGQYINTYAIGTGASLLMVHHIPANNSFLFIWENP